MNFTRVLAQHRQPMIRFLGKRSPPAKIDHTPQVHPASPTGSLPSSFAAYRQKAQQHGPLTSDFQSGGSRSYGSASQYGGRIGSKSGSSLGPVEAEKGLFFDRDELPARFRRSPLTEGEMEAITSGGASLFA
ncbi:hypothetical protein C1H76_4894 [Elsinoe australis]|uniref:37S ribosomal protein YMR-31, mitochondrial n=1 Tax=Elsinoe australis TaxID=40998 RepID=A0A2P7ZMF2_9PEZI|nr:hypothetical protein B9Z65_8206 [Elsinoe australis]TKX22860.1 hypothetical protein C1H76_4894 [Elsinoe australis]